jgi:hypothetical protein
MQSDGLANAAPNAVPHHGLTDGAGNGKTEAWTVRLRLTDDEGGKQRACELRARVVNPSKVFGSQQTNTFRKTRDGELPLGADRQFVAAAGAATSKNGTTVLGFHPGAKSVRLGAAAIIRLKGTFRHGDSRI